MKKIKFYIIFLSISILFLLFDWYHSRKLNLDYIKMIFFFSYNCICLSIT
ncbi:hypothetical protein HCG64_06725 [Coprobacillus sp. K06]|nr:hypothetical protein [Coprobacillus sp. K06]MBX9164755.1 hypothetical protein [Coprobacillus sp. K06]